ncbi:MAG: class I SAM-dependent methyltransferase [Flavobacteriaceae bacterium]|nr:class I SAM-dependent methyltransferase [Flavobacteriaceae bacterium]
MEHSKNISNKETYTYLKVTDHALTKEVFSLVAEENGSVLKTHPQPKKNEIGKYYQNENYISHTDVKSTLFDKLYHIVRKIATKQKLKNIEKLTRKKGKILDIGAGTGEFVKAAKNSGWLSEGIEPDAGARNKASEKGVSLHSETKQYADKSFDIVTLWHVLEHVYHPDEQIKEIYRLLKEGGTAVIAVPNFTCYSALYYKNHWAAFDVPRHLWHFSPKYLKKKFTTEHFECVKTEPLYQDAFYINLLSEKYKTGKSNPVRAFWIALKCNLLGRKKEKCATVVYYFRKKSNKAI